MKGAWRYWIVIGLLTAAVVAGLQLHEVPGRGRDLSFTLLAGLAAGIVFQRSQFCFASAFRDLYLRRDRRVLLGLLVALVVGSVGYLIVFGARVDPSSVYLPDTAHIGVLGWHLILGGAVFGFGMVVGGGCITGHLFRLGEGSAVALIGLVGVYFGYMLGLACWNWVYLNLVGSNAFWLPAKVGYAASFGIQIVVLATAAALVIDHTPVPPHTPWPPATLFVVGRRLFIERWPAWVGGIVLGLIATFTYLRTTPLGVTEEIGRLARRGGDAAGLLPDRLHGLDQMRGCAAVSNPHEMSLNGVFIIAFLGGSMMSALLAGEFRPRGGSGPAFARVLGGGVLVGFGAMIALGCTVGTLMSGIMAFSLSGWIFLAALAGGAWLGTRAMAKASS